MGLEQDLKDRVGAIVRQKWAPRDGTVVPDPEKVALDGDAVKLDAVVLYADMVGSSALVENYEPVFATEMYKSFLYCAGRIITACHGDITAYDGDRVMAVFLGSSKNTRSAFCALKINHAVTKIINPTVAEYYKDRPFFVAKPYAIKHVVGVDASTVHVAKTGIRGANDLVWVGRAANFAARLSALRHEGYESFITAEVYNCLQPEAKKFNEKDMWTALNFSGRSIYASHWNWGVEYATPVD